MEMLMFSFWRELEGNVRLQRIERDETGFKLLYLLLLSTA